MMNDVQSLNQIGPHMHFFMFVALSVQVILFLGSCFGPVEPEIRHIYSPSSRAARTSLQITCDPPIVWSKRSMRFYLTIEEKIDVNYEASCVPGSAVLIMDDGTRVGMSIHLIDSEGREVAVPRIGSRDGTGRRLGADIYAALPRRGVSSDGPFVAIKVDSDVPITVSDVYSYQADLK